MVFKGKKGYSLIIAVIAVNVFAILLMMARSMWETEIKRDLEEELIFRARQYTTAIELYRAKNSNIFPQALEILYAEKFLRKTYPDPMTESGEWNLVMQAIGGGSKSLLIVPPQQLGVYLTRAQLIGVASSSTEEGFREYRKKKRYCEWAIYVGEDISKDMPELTFVALEGEKGKDTKETGKESKETDSEGREVEREEGRENEKETSGRGEEKGEESGEGDNG
ncbi:MAG: hypothetical protein L0Y73_04510 [Candidatus Aminicenantes bacterium]|nr:hypothetical protein [Candidatus Aminicenantes bacterium]